MYFKVGWEEGVWGGGHGTLKIIVGHGWPTRTFFEF